MHDFSPHLAEKYVWKLNNRWLMVVPCFSLVVERIQLQPKSGMERFLIRVAMEMAPATFVPTEKPPGKRLYIITDGEALHWGRALTKGDTWGAYDVLLNSSQLKRAERASAVTYLHVLFVSASTFETIGAEHRQGLMLSRLWAMLNAAGTELIRMYRQQRAAACSIKIGYELESRFVRPADVQRRINSRQLSVEPMRGEGERKQYSTDGLVLFKFKYEFIDSGDYEIVAIKSQDHDALALKFAMSVASPKNALSLKSQSFEVRRRSSASNEDDGAPRSTLKEGVGAHVGAERPDEPGGARVDEGGGLTAELLAELRKLRQVQEQDSQTLRALSDKVEQLSRGQAAYGHRGSTYSVASR